MRLNRISEEANELFQIAAVVGARAARLAVHFVEAAMLTQRHAQKAVRYTKLAAEQAEAQARWDVAGHLRYLRRPQATGSQ